MLTDYYSPDLSDATALQQLADDGCPNFGNDGNDGNDGMTVSHRKSRDFVTAAPLVETTKPVVIERETAKTLPKCIVSWGLHLFNDQYGRSWVRVPVNGHLESVPMAGERFRNLLVRRLAEHGVVPTVGLLKQCLTILAALADDHVVTVANRSAGGVARNDVWIDLADDRRRAIHICPDGYKVVPDPPVLFEPFAHQLPLPHPEGEGSPDELFRFFPPLAEDDRLLLLAWAATSWVQMPRPILMLIGPQGSAKTTIAAFLRRLIDPSRMELLGADDRADLPLLFHRHALPVCDNIDKLSAKQADLFCQATTGRGFDRRKLYTDDGNFILAVQRPILVTSLHLPTTRADFLDRSLILDLDRVLPERRREMRFLEAEFMEARPRLFGALLTTLAGALKSLPEVSDQKLSRMADFHRLGRAVALTVGRSAADFDRAWAIAEGRQKRGVLGDLLAQVFWLFARHVKTWQGPAEDLVRQLRDTAKEHRIRLGDTDGLSPVGLGRRLKVLSESMSRFGVRLTQRRKAHIRNIVVEYDQAADSEAQEV